MLKRLEIVYPSFTKMNYTFLLLWYLRKITSKANYNFMRTINLQNHALDVCNLILASHFCRLDKYQRCCAKRILLKSSDWKSRIAYSQAKITGKYFDIHALILDWNWILKKVQRATPLSHCKFRSFVFRRVVLWPFT